MVLWRTPRTSRLGTVEQLGGGLEAAGVAAVPPKINWRELLQILQADRQIGLPCSVNADASLGWALYAYHSAEISTGHCQGAQNILSRVTGSRCRGSEAPKANLPRRAKCGLCPRCARATHVLIPATCEAGSFGRRKANTVRLWQLYGPMASRTYAAALYFNMFGYVPTGWNWIAAKHVAMLPPPLDSVALRPNEVSEPSDSHLALEDASPSCPMPISPPPALSSFSPAPKISRAAKPPPPIYPDTPSPSPAKSGRPSKGSQSYGKHSWDGEWQSTRDGNWRWGSRRN